MSDCSYLPYISAIFVGSAQPIYMCCTYAFTAFVDLARVNIFSSSCSTFFTFLFLLRFPPPFCLYLDYLGKCQSTLLWLMGGLFTEICVYKFALRRTVYLTAMMMTYDEMMKTTIKGDICLCERRLVVHGQMLSGRCPRLKARIKAWNVTRACANLDVVTESHTYVYARECVY